MLGVSAKIFRVFHPPSPLVVTLIYLQTLCVGTFTWVKKTTTLYLKHEIGSASERFSLLVTTG